MDWLDRFIRAYRSSGRRCCDAYASASFTALRRRWIRAETPSTWIDLPKTSQPSFDRADENSFLPMRKAAFHTNARISSVNVVLVLRQSAYGPTRGSTSGHANMRMSRKPAKSTRQKSGMEDVHIGNSCNPASLFACASGSALRMLFMSIMTGRYACGTVFTKYSTGLASEYMAHVSAAPRSVATHGWGCTRSQSHVSTGIHLPASYSCCDARRCVAVACASLFAALASATPPVAMAASLRTLTTVRLNCATMLLLSAVITCAAEYCVTVLNSLPGKSAGSMDPRTCAFTPSISSQSSALNAFDCLCSVDATNLVMAARMLASRKGKGRCPARRRTHHRARNSCKSAVARWLFTATQARTVAMAGCATISRMPQGRVDTAPSSLSAMGGACGVTSAPAPGAGRRIARTIARPLDKCVYHPAQPTHDFGPSCSAARRRRGGLYCIQRLSSLRITPCNCVHGCRQQHRGGRGVRDGSGRI